MQPNNPNLCDMESQRYNVLVELPGKCCDRLFLCRFACSCQSFPSKVCALWQEIKKKKKASVELNAPYTCATRNILHHQQRSVIMCMQAVDRSDYICSRAGRSRCLSGSSARLDAFHSCHTTERKKKKSEGEPSFLDAAEAPRRWRDSCVVLANVNKRV